VGVTPQFINGKEYEEFGQGKFSSSGNVKQTPEQNLNELE
jgi:hypothetical protein